MRDMWHFSFEFVLRDKDGLRKTEFEEVHITFISDKKEANV
jgi:hypothetical protein